MPKHPSPWRRAGHIAAAAAFIVLTGTFGLAGPVEASGGSRQLDADQDGALTLSEFDIEGPAEWREISILAEKPASGQQQ